jgi:hypothetical protein
VLYLPILTPLVPLVFFFCSAKVKRAGLGVVLYLKIPDFSDTLWFRV